MSTINQKEYLKKYLGIGRAPGEKKKHKKKVKAAFSRLKIVDDDIDVITLSEEITQDINGETEDAPQIVAVIDERPLSLQVDEKTKNKLWKPVGSVRPNYVQPKLESPSKNVNKISKFDDKSPPRRSRDDDDSSPIRKRRRNSNDGDGSPRRNRNKVPIRGATDFQLSPRNDKHNKSPHRPIIKIEILDSSPVNTIDDDYSPPRRTRDISSSRETNKTDYSPPRRNESKQSRSEKNRKSRWSSNSPKMRKTLDGKTAGLQNAKELVKETQLIRQKEDETFKNMSAEVSGENAETVVRRKSRHTEIDQMEEAQRKQREKENQEKYNKWGRGLKQVEDRNDKIAQEVYEMSKPLARYADDEDLEKYLKEQEREGDPMLAYIRKKKHKKTVESGAPIKPVYQGEFLPNRFGIAPGYRWDGVDRSNGYETKWLTNQNSKKAALDESYKWSTEDM